MKKDIVAVPYKGIDDTYDASTLGEGKLVSLKNWVPEPNGILRPRRGWLNALKTGLPATCRGKGLSSWQKSGTRKIVVALDDNAANFEIYEKDQPIGSNTWTLRDTLAVASRTLPVVFASGAGAILYSHPGFPNSRIRKWNAAAASDVSTDAISGRALAYHKSRFFTGGSTSEPTRLRYCELGDPATWTVATNYIDVNFDDGEPIEDLCTFDNGLVVGKENSLHFLAGSGPDSFSLAPIDGGGCAPGRSLVVTARGLVAVGKKHVWLWSGGEVIDISKPIHGSFGLAGDFVSALYLDNKVRITDNGSSTIWVWDVEQDIWYQETYTSANDAPTMLYKLPDGYMLGCTKASTTKGIMYRDEINGPRALDAGFGITYNAKTGDMWLGGPVTEAWIHQLFLKMRQLGGLATDVGLVITVRAGAQTQTKTLTPRNGAATFRELITFGNQSFPVSIEFSQALDAGTGALHSIEGVVAEIVTEERR